MFSRKTRRAVNAAKMASESQPAPVPQADAAQQLRPHLRRAVKAPINFGDFRSSTLATKAWAALAQNDIESVLAYTNKCISLYAARPVKCRLV